MFDRSHIALNFMIPETKGLFFRLKHRRALGVTGIPVVYKL